MGSGKRKSFTARVRGVGKARWSAIVYDGLGNRSLDLAPLRRWRCWVLLRLLEARLRISGDGSLMQEASVHHEFIGPLHRSPTHFAFR
jgi:hypothetical protein